jgi:deoxyribodipyrimidine photolyase
MVEKKQVSEPNNQKYFRSHLVTIDNAIENGDWFSGFSNAVTYFEYWDIIDFTGIV